LTLTYTLPALLVAAATALYTLRWWIPTAHRLGFTGRDMNKSGDVRVAEAGGVWVSLGASFGILTCIALVKYTGSSQVSEEEYMALALLLLLSSFLGFLDDLLGWKKGLRAVYRILLMLPLSIPLVVIKAGYTKIALPLVGTVDLGLLYPLLLVPVGVMGAANAFNMIAGYNGLEATQGAILMAFTAVFSYAKGLYSVFTASVIMLAALVVFLVHNWYPAKVFPGNSLTYGVGAYYASLVIIGNFEKFGLLQFTLYFIELLLFLRGLRDGVYKENFGVPQPDGSIKLPYSKSYSITHVAIKIQIKLRGYATERGVVVTVALLQTLISTISLLIALYVWS